jgi:hypothetical protein
LRANEDAWAKTVLVINYDEWGGFFDHVTPPTVVDDSTDAVITVGAPPQRPGSANPDEFQFSFNQLGFRVPCIVASPFAPAQVWKQGPYEHTSVLKMIEWRWGLDPLNARDANARNLAEVLDLSKPVGANNALAVGSFPPAPAQAQPCGPQSAHYTHPSPVVGPELPEVPIPAALPLAAVAAGGAALAMRRRSRPAVATGQADIDVDSGDQS